MQPTQKAMASTNGAPSQANGGQKRAARFIASKIKKAISPGSSTPKPIASKTKPAEGMPSSGLLLRRLAHLNLHADFVVNFPVFRIGDAEVLAIDLEFTGDVEKLLLGDRQDKRDRFGLAPNREIAGDGHLVAPGVRNIQGLRRLKRDLRVLFDGEEIVALEMNCQLIRVGIERLRVDVDGQVLDPGF